jgi:hypothetical protein
VFGGSYVNYKVFCDGSDSQTWLDGGRFNYSTTGAQTVLLGDLL